MVEFGSWLLIVWLCGRLVIEGEFCLDIFDILWACSLLGHDGEQFLGEDINLVAEIGILTLQFLDVRCLEC